MFPENGWTFNNTQIIQLNKALLRRSWTQAFNDMKNLSKNLKNVIFAAFDPVAQVWVVKLKDASLPQFFLIKVVDIEWKKKSYFTFKIQVCLHGVAWQGKSLKKKLYIYTFNSFVAMATMLFWHELVKIFETWYLKTYCKYYFQIWT